MDACLLAFLLLEHEKGEHLVSHLQKQWDEHSVLYVPIYTKDPYHWSLLILSKDSENKAVLADSLKKDAAPEGSCNSDQESLDVQRGASHHAFHRCSDL